MKIESIQTNPLHEIPYQFVESGGREVVTEILPILEAEVDVLPNGVDAVLVTSDLQGVEDKWQADQAGREPRLIGKMLADEVYALAELGEIPSPDKIGVILAGDLYVSKELDKRGGKGDVREIWQAFAEYFKWVVGVPGNHDHFGDDSSPDPFTENDEIYYLDGDSLELNGLKIAGLGGVIGRSSKPFRRSEEEFIGKMLEQLAEKPDILLMHESPEFPEKGLPGNPAIRKALENTTNATLVICGHKGWEQPMAELTNNIKVLNVDHRAILLVKSE